MGVLLLVAVIIGALITFDVDGKIARATNDMVALIAGGGKDDAAAAPAAGRQPGGGQQPGGGNGPGGGRRPRRSGGNGRARQRARWHRRPRRWRRHGRGGGARHGALPRLRQEAGNCLLAARAPNTVSETITERARDKVRQAQRNLYNSSARPGSPEYTRLVEARYEGDQGPRQQPPDHQQLHRQAARAGPQGSSTRAIEDIQARASTARRETLRGTKTNAPVPLKPNTSSGGPVKPSPASKFLKGLGKVGKGLGVAGTALSLYDNVKNDGVAKGLTKTAGGVAGAWGAGAAVTAGCAAVGVATAGVGGLACAGVALGASYFGGKYGSPDRGLGLRSRRGRRRTSRSEEVFKPVGEATESPSRRWWTSAARRSTAGRRCIGAVNPFG